MARPKLKRGFRPIVVDGQRFRWRLSWDNKTADIEIHLEGSPSVRGRRLCVYLDSFAYGLPDRCIESEIAWTDGKVVTPSFVVAVMRDAMSKGWTPSVGTEDSNLFLRTIQ